MVFRCCGLRHESAVTQVSIDAIEMKRLSEFEYLATFGHPMKRLAPEVAPPFDFWDYFESIPASHFDGHDCSARAVTYVWEHPNGRFQHVLVNSEDRNIFMVLVLDVSGAAVLGHRLLDLDREYGLSRA
jgi:hypothetical protein